MRGLRSSFRFIDYLIQSNLFNYTAPSVGSQILPKVNVDFPVNVKPTRTIDTRFSSMGWRIPSRTSRRNSGSSSKKRTPR